MANPSILFPELTKLFSCFLRAGHDLFLVGGAVRDQILYEMGHPAGKSLQQQKDLDFCTDATPIRALEILRAAKYPTYEVGMEFGTVGTLLRFTDSHGGKCTSDVQITTYRCEESYTKGSRHPSVAFGKTIDEDLWRRDFSINSIAMDHKGTLVDPYKGSADIKGQVIRVVNDPLVTLQEDPLRILRAARFISQLGFVVDGALWEAVRVRAPEIQAISHERWLQEMDKLLLGEHVIGGLVFLEEVGLLQEIFPEVVRKIEKVGPYKWLAFQEFLYKLPRHQPDGVNLAWAALVQFGEWEGARRLVAPITERFVMSNKSHAIMAAIVGAPHAYMESLVVYEQELGVWERAEGGGPVALLGEIGELTPRAMGAIRRLFARVGGHTELALDFWSPVFQGCRRPILGHGPFEKPFGLPPFLWEHDRDEAANPRLDALWLCLIEHFRHSARLLAQANQLTVSMPTGIGGALMKAYNLAPGPEVGKKKDELLDLFFEGIFMNGESLFDSLQHLEDYYQRLKELEESWYY